MLHFQSLHITDMSLVAHARRTAAELARSLGFDETAAGKVSLVATEIASNLVKHVPAGGELLLGPLQDGNRVGVEMVALDQGAGIPNLNEALRDGYSTAGSRGVGLGAIQRLSHQFDLYSQPGKGTVLLTRLWSQPPAPQRPALYEFGGVLVAKPGQEACGDAWAVVPLADGLAVLVADGLGHGMEAAAASQEAVRTFLARPHLQPEELLLFIHGALRHTRGAAVAAAQLTAAPPTLHYGGLGNIGGVVLSEGAARHLVSQNGTAGHAVRKVQQFPYPWSAGATLILHSDGLATRWNLDDYPGLIQRHPTLIAGVLYRDFRRGNDDTAVVVIRQRA